VNLVSLLTAPLIVTFAKQAETNGTIRLVTIVVMLVLLGIVVWAVFRSKSGGSSTQDLVAPIETAATAGD
jgi:hypothetical protein